jgi:hypothetical protein
MILSGIVGKILGGSTVVLGIACATMFFTIKVKNSTITDLKDSNKEYRFFAIADKKKIENDSMAFTNIIRETQSVLAQIHNKNKSLEKENSLLRRGIRLDLLTVRERRNGKVIDSVYTQGYKYLNK